MYNLPNIVPKQECSIQDDEEKAARPRRGAAAKLLEEETAVLAKVNNKVKKMTPEEVKEKIGQLTFYTEANSTDHFTCLSVRLF